MDKPPESRRGVSRFSPAKRQTKQSGHKLISVLNGRGNVGSLERSKREKVRGSNHVGRGGSSSNEDNDMVGGSEEEEEELRQPLKPLPPPTTGSTKRTKFPSKPFDECNGVDPAAVPRKLRSAMIKRSHESMSPPLSAAKKLRDTANLNGIETPQINGVKKVKQRMNQFGGSDGSLKQPVSGPITKDEEEVVETLYALARMVPDNPVMHQVNDKTSKTKFSPLPEAKQSSVPASEALEEEHKKLLLPSKTAEANKTERLTGDPVVSNSTECTTLEHPCITENQKFGLGSNGPATHANLHMVPLLSKTGEIPICTAERLRDPSELCPDTGLVEPKQHDNHLPKRKTENMFWPVTGVGVNQGQELPINGTKDDETCTEGGPILWPGLCTAGLSADGVRHSLEWHSSTRAPTWIDTATCSIRPSSAENIVLSEKVSPVAERNQSWKRCVAHVYISHLIQAFPTADKTGRWPITSDQFKEKEGMKSGLVAKSNPTGRNGLNGVMSATNINVSSAEKSLNDQRLGFPLEKRLQKDQKQAATTPGMDAPLSQSCNFLSLSSGDDGLGASCNDNGSNKNGNNLVGNGLEQPTQLHVPYLHSLVQHRPLLPFSMAHTRYSSGPYPDQLTAAAATGQQVQMHLPQYLGNPFYGPPHLGHVGTVKQQQHAQPAHMWATQPATQYRSTGIPVFHLSKWHNGRPETSPFIPCAQAIQATTSPTSLEVELGAKFSPGQQQKHLFAMGSSPSQRGKKQQHHLPSSHDQVGGGFHSEGSSRMQLLCNAEHM